jgi:hypothetical protein
MARSSTFERLWHLNDELEIPEEFVKPKRAPLGTCEYGMALEQYVVDLFETFPPEGDLVRINQLKLKIADRFHVLWGRLPQRHGSLGDGVRGHRCLFAVYYEAYKVLCHMQDSLLPPTLAPPQEDACRNCELRKQLERLTTVDAMMMGQVDPEFDGES